MSDAAPAMPPTTADPNSPIDALDERERQNRLPRLMRESSLYAIAGGLGKALALLTVPILSRLLSPSEYGLGDLANSLAGVLAAVAMCAGDIPAARLLGQSAHLLQRTTILATYVWTRAATGILIALILLPFAQLIASDVWSAPTSAGIAWLALALIPIGALQATIVTTQRLLARPVAFAVLATIDLLSQMLLAVLFVLLGWGATGMVAGFVVGSSVGLVAAAIHTRALIMIMPDWRLGWAMLVEGSRFLPAALSFVAANYVVRFLLVDAHGQGDVGLFGVAIRLAGGMALLTGAFSMAWGPFGLALPDTRKTARLFGRVMRAYAFVAVLASLALGAVGPELIRIVSGDEYLGAATMLPGLLVAAAMAGGFYVLLVAAGVSRRGGWVAIAAVSGAVVQVLTTAILLPMIGLQSVGVGAVAGQGLALVILVWAVGASVHGGAIAVGAMFAGGAAAIGIQVLSGAPDGTVVVRVAIAFVSALAAVGLLLTLLRPRRAATA